MLFRGVAKLLDSPRPVSSRFGGRPCFLFIDPILSSERAYRLTKPRNPRHLDTIEGGRVYETLLVTIQIVTAIYRGKTTVSDTFWHPGGV